jgi:DNA polymerase beta thumb
MAFMKNTKAKIKIPDKVILKKIFLVPANFYCNIIGLASSFNFAYLCQGVCNLHKTKGHKKSKSTFRHLDVRVCPHDQYHCMILHFTGSSHFNQNMRQHAQSQGFTLNEYTLRPIGSTGETT